MEMFENLNVTWPYFCFKRILPAIYGDLSRREQEKKRKVRKHINNLVQIRDDGVLARAVLEVEVRSG